MTIATNLGFCKITLDNSLAPDVAQVLIAVLDALPLILVPDTLPVTRKAHLFRLLSGQCTPRIYSRLVMALWEATTVVHVNQRLTRQTFCSSFTKVAHTQSMNIAKKDLLAIKVDFLARALERTLHAIATTQSLPHLRFPGQGT